MVNIPPLLCSTPPPIDFGDEEEEDDSSKVVNVLALVDDDDDDDEDDNADDVGKRVIIDKNYNKHTLPNEIDSYMSSPTNGILDSGAFITNITPPPLDEHSMDHNSRVKPTPIIQPIEAINLHVTTTAMGLQQVVVDDDDDDATPNAVTVTSEKPAGVDSATCTGNQENVETTEAIQSTLEAVDTAEISETPPSHSNNSSNADETSANATETNPKHDPHTISQLRFNQVSLEDVDDDDFNDDDDQDNKTQPKITNNITVIDENSADYFAIHVLNEALPNSTAPAANEFTATVADTATPPSNHKDSPSTIDDEFSFVHFTNNQCDDDIPDDSNAIVTQEIEHDFQPFPLAATQAATTAINGKAQENVEESTPEMTDFADFEMHSQTVAGDEVSTQSEAPTKEECAVDGLNGEAVGSESTAHLDSKNSADAEDGGDDDFDDFQDFTSHVPTTTTDVPMQQKAVAPTAVADDAIDDFNDDFGDFEEATFAPVPTAAPTTTATPALSHSAPTADSTSHTELKLDLASIESNLEPVLKMMFPAVPDDESATAASADLSTPTMPVSLLDTHLPTNATMQLQSIDTASALQYQWIKSNGRYALIKSLGIDARNVLFGEKWSKPIFAADLTSLPLKPINYQPTTTTTTPANATTNNGINATTTTTGDDNTQVEIMGSFVGAAAPAATLTPNHTATTTTTILSTEHTSSPVITTEEIATFTTKTTSMPGGAQTLTPSPPAGLTECGNTTMHSTDTSALNFMNAHDFNVAGRVDEGAPGFGNIDDSTFNLNLKKLNYDSLEVEDNVQRQANSTTRTAVLTPASSFMMTPNDNGLLHQKQQQLPHSITKVTSTVSGAYDAMNSIDFDIMELEAKPVPDARTQSYNAITKTFPDYDMTSTRGGAVGKALTSSGVDSGGGDGSNISVNSNNNSPVASNFVDNYVSNYNNNVVGSAGGGLSSSSIVYDDIDEVIVTSTFAGPLKETHIYTPPKTTSNNKPTTTAAATTIRAISPNKMNMNATLVPTPASSINSKPIPIDFDYEIASTGIIIDETVVKKEYRDIEYNPQFDLQNASSGVNNTEITATTAVPTASELRSGGETERMPQQQQQQQQGTSSSAAPQNSVPLPESSSAGDWDDDFTEFQSAPLPLQSSNLSNITANRLHNDSSANSSAPATPIRGIILSPAILMPQAIHPQQKQQMNTKIEWGNAAANINPEELARIEALFSQNNNNHNNNSKQTITTQAATTANKESGAPSTGTSQRSTPKHTTSPKTNASNHSTSFSISATIASKERRQQNQYDEDDDWSEFVYVPAAVPAATASSKPTPVYNSSNAYVGTTTTQMPMPMPMQGQMRMALSMPMTGAAGVLQVKSTSTQSQLQLQLQQYQYHQQQQLQQHQQQFTCNKHYAINTNNFNVNNDDEWSDFVSSKPPPPTSAAGGSTAAPSSSSTSATFCLPPPATTKFSTPASAAAATTTTTTAQSQSTAALAAATATGTPVRLYTNNNDAITSRTTPTPTTATSSSSTASADPAQFSIFTQYRSL